MASELGYLFLLLFILNSLLSKNQCLNTCVYKWIISVLFSDTNWLKNRRKRLYLGYPRNLIISIMTYVNAPPPPKKKQPTYPTLKTYKYSLDKPPFCISPCSKTPTYKYVIVILLHSKSCKKCHKNFENRLVNKNLTPQNDLDLVF